MPDDIHVIHNDDEAAAWTASGRTDPTLRWSRRGWWLTQIGDDPDDQPIRGLRHDEAGAVERAHEYLERDRFWDVEYLATEKGLRLTKVHRDLHYQITDLANSDALVGTDELGVDIDTAEEIISRHGQ